MDTGSLLIIIPARGGSKRIPWKNIKEICGQPMIYWPLIELSKKFSPNQILVSTDSSEIISIVEKRVSKYPSFAQIHYLMTSLVLCQLPLMHYLGLRKMCR